LMIFLYVKNLPMRWPILNFMRIFVFLTQMVQLLMIFFEVEYIGEETVSMIITILCAVESLTSYICFARELYLWDLFQNGARLITGKIRKLARARTTQKIANIILKIIEEYRVAVLLSFIYQYKRKFYA